MYHAINSSYRGFSITTRWRETETSAGKAPWFKASFTVNSDNSSEDSWQQFPDSEFATSGAASANALRAARISVDLHASRPAMAHSARMVDAANMPVETGTDVDAPVLDVSQAWWRACAQGGGWN
jgi:hypothetical protein